MAVQDDETLLLKAPKESQNMRTAEKGITQSMHKFSFSQVRSHSCMWCSILDQSDIGKRKTAP